MFSRKTAIACAAAAALCLMSLATASADPIGTVDWKGVTWSIYSASTTAVVNGNGGLDISVMGGENGDPGNDNWVLKGTPLSGMTQANAPWIKFTIKDDYAGDATAAGPRAFWDIYSSDYNAETMFQGGVYSGYSTYMLNHNVYDGNNGGWANDPNNWYQNPARSAGSHTVEFGMTSTGSVDMWIDGTLGMTIPASPLTTDLSRVWLGVSAPTGVTSTVTYEDLQWGTGYTSPVPEPSSLGVFAGLAGLALLSRRSRRRIA